MERLPLPEAARRLGLSSVAVRKRAQRGTIQGEKVAGEWWILLEGPSGQAAHGPSTDRAVRAVQVDALPGPSVPPTSVQAAHIDGPAVDMAAVAELGAVAREALAQLAQEREQRSHAEQAAAMWQERARNLEAEVGRLQELLALPAHEEAFEPSRRWWQWWRRREQHAGA